MLNEYLHISLQRNMNVRNAISLPPQGFQTFSHIVCIDEDLLQRYVLLVNKQEGYCLFSSQPKFNYILALLGIFSAYELKQIERLIRMINEVNAVIPIDTGLLNDNDKELLFILE